ncbi:uncharacterized protein [Gossypium hirsutum]|uniref:BTB domain-containing protein n=1 Tax=Gossypium hirsutum TaxID=3635 RepID=A0ABM3AYX4_GOSHI|nr:uncharacterized protein LOC107911150 [Gossypium hirsutum]
MVKVHTPNHREEKMSVEEEYYINLHVGGKFVHDPHVKYLGGKMVRLKEYPEHFEAIIGDYPKMKLRDIQRMEFATLWDYVDELGLKNTGSAIKMAVNRVTPESPPHFKRFYVCFEALKRGWKEGCRNTALVWYEYTN